LPPQSTTSRPSRALAFLAVIFVIMLLGILGRNIGSPGNWHSSFKVGLGLDLSSGSTVTLKAITARPGQQVSQSAMAQSRSIMLSRVNGAGFTGATVQPQGSNIITVSVPGQDASKVVKLVGATALLRFRQVLLVAPNTTTTTSSSKSTKTVTRLSTTANGQGDAAALTPAVRALFDKLNCATDWQQRVYHGDPNLWDNTRSQIVTCFRSGGTWFKYALGRAVVTGDEVTSASPGLNPNNPSQWQVNLSFNSAGARAFGTLTTDMFQKYQGSQTNPLNQFAIVLDGKPVSIPFVQQAIPTGSGEITGVTQSEADYLAQVLKYGALKLSFQKESVESISPQLGATQLHAGLIAAAIGLFLVVVYSFIYYRGLGIVSVSSLAISALLTYLSVVLLSRYASFTLSLAGIAGLIVAIGITADSFVVFFERLRDEVREGKSLRPAVERGWKRARRTILVSDTVSFLAAALLWYFAIGDVKGFAFTLGLTTLIDVVVVFTFTKPMVTLLARTSFFGGGHKLSGLDPERLGARAPWRGSRVPVRSTTPGEA
jgi:preprotein translocase subunit SecD